MLSRTLTRSSFVSTASKDKAKKPKKVKVSTIGKRVCVAAHARQQHLKDIEPDELESPRQ